MNGSDARAHVLKLLAPGRMLRDAIEAISRAGTGALIVVGDDTRVAPLCEAGFFVGEPLSVARLTELAAIDGGIVLSADAGTILRANVHLHPERDLPTSETGIRHRTAERVSRQTSALVLAVSSDGTATLYQDGTRGTLP